MRNQQNGRNPQAGQLSSPHQIRELKERLDSIEVDQESLKSQVDNVEKKAEKSASDSGGSGTNATFLYLRAQDGPAIKNNSGSVTFDIMKVEGNDSADVYQGSDFDIRNYDPTKADASGQNFGQKVTLNASDIDGKQALYLCVSDGSEVVDTDTAVDITDGQGGGYVEAVTPVTATYLQQDASFTINPLKVRGYFYKTGTTTNPEIARVQLYPTYDGSLKATYTKTKDLDSDGTSPISVSVQNQNGNALNEGESATAKSAREVVVKFTYEDPNTSQTAVATETLYLTTETGPGDYVSYVFQRSDSQPNRPANSAGGTYNDPSVPADWSDSPPVGEKRLWLSKATYEYASDGPVDTDEDGNVWSTPVRLKGEDSGLFTLFASKPKPSDPDKTKISGRPGSTTWNGASDWKTTPNDLSTDAYYMARAVWKNESWQAFDVTRIKGEKGDAAQIVRIDASSQVFTLQKDGTHAPSSITLRAVQQNIDDPTFEWTYNGSTTQSTNVSILPEDLGDDGTVSVTLSEVGTSNSDEITLVRVTEGADASTVVLSNQNHTYPADQDGNVDSSLFSEGASEIEAYVGASRANVLQSRLGASSASQKGGTTTSGFAHVLYDGPVSDLSLSSGDDITFVGEIRTAQNTSQSGRLLVEFWDGSGGKISDIKSDFENSTEWQSLSANGTVPVGTNRIVLGYAVESVSSGNEQLVEGRYGAVHKSTQPLPAYNAYVSETNINGSVDRSQPQTISYEPSGSMPNDRASALVTFKIVREDGEVEARDKQIEYSKARAGTDSEAFSLSASSQVFAVNKSGNVSTQDPISLLVNRQNISSSVTWKTKNADGTDSSVTLTSKSDSLAELSYSDLEDANKQQVTVRAEAGGYSDEVTIAIIREGKDAVTALLSNENHSYSASSDGSVSDYSTGATTLSVYEGANKLSGGGGTPGFSVSVTKNNVSGSYSSGTFTPSGMSASEGSVEFEITVTKSDGSTQTINKTATYSVVTDGASASSVSIEAESQVFRVSKSGAVSPSKIGLNSVKQNVSSVSWSASDNVSFDSTPKSGYDQSVSKSSLDANGVGQVSITASGGGDSDTLTLAVIREGSDALTPILTNENHTFTAASDGTIAGSEYSSGATDVKIYEGATQLAADSTSNPSNGTFNVSSVTSTNINASKTENASSFTISPSGGMDNSESASIDITIDVVKQNGDEATITKTVTYSKSVAGSDGSDAKAVSLSAQSQIFAVDQSDSVTTTNPIKFTANKENISSGFSWSTFNTSGNDSPVTLSSTNGNTATLSYSDLTGASEKEVTVRASAGGLFDEITVSIVEDGTDAVTVLLSNENHTYQAQSDGSVSDYSTGKTTIKVYRGDSQLSVGSDFSVSKSESNVSGNLVDAVYTPTGMSSGEGSVEFTVTVNKAGGGTETFTKTATYSKSIAGEDNQDFDFLGVDKSKIKDTAGLYTNNDFLGYFRDDANGSLNPNERARAYLDNSGNFYLNDQNDDTGLVYEANLSGGNGIFAVGDIGEAKDYHQGNSVSNDSSFLSYSKASANSELVFKGEIDAFGRIESFNPGGELAVRIDNDSTFNTPTSSNNQSDSSFTLSSSGDSTTTSVSIESGTNEVTITISGDAGYIEIGGGGSQFEGETYDIPSSMQVELKASSSGALLTEEWLQINESSVSGKTVNVSFDGQGHAGENIEIVVSNVYANNGNISLNGITVKSYDPTTEINARGVQVAYTNTDYVRIGASGITSTGGIETGSGAGVNFTSEGKLYADGSALYWSSGSNLTRIDSKVVEGTSGDSDKLDGNHGSYYLDASNINDGTLGTSYVPNLSASKITSGTFAAGRIPNLGASKINSGTLGTARIPNLDASKITSGTFDAARIPDSTQYSDSDAVSAIESSIGSSSLVAQPATSGGSAEIRFKSNVNYGSDFGLLKWYDDNDNYNTGTGSETGVIALEAENDDPGGGIGDHVVLNPAGHIYLDTDDEIRKGDSSSYNVVWHAGNDGSGSGLDADKLDGVQGTNFARTDINESFLNKVGIKDTDPHDALTIGGANYLGFDGTNNNEDAGIYWRNSNEGALRAKILSVSEGPYGDKGIAFYTGDAEDYTTVDVTSERVRITKSGRLGINTPSPNHKLHVEGEIYTNNLIGVGRVNNFAQINIDSNASSNSDINFLWTDAGTSEWDIFADADNNYDLNVVDKSGSGDKMMTFKHGGNIGIGVTNPTEKLMMTGATGQSTGASVASFFIKSENSFIGVDAKSFARLGLLKQYGYRPVLAAGSDDKIILGHSGKIDLRDVNDDSAFTKDFVIKPNGNVGINTNNAQGKFEVRGTQRDLIKRRTDDNSFFVNEWQNSSGTKLFHQGINNEGYYYIYDQQGSNSGYRFKVKPDGATTFENANVGIQKTNPSTALGVSGTVTASGDLMPSSNYSGNIGLPQKKWLSLHAAELRVEKYVTGENIVTRGDRLTVAQHAKIVSGPGSSSGDHSYFTLDTNSLRGGDTVHLQSGGKVEFMTVDYFGASDDDAVYKTVTVDGETAYEYRFTRGDDETAYSENDWGPGDVMVNTGASGDAMIDLYAINPITDAAENATAGPTIAGLVRQSATWDDIPPRWALGNLNTYYDYGSDTYGFAAGNYGGTWVAADDSKGFRVMRGNTKKIGLDTDGNAYFSGQVSAQSGDIANWSIESNQITRTFNGYSSYVELGETPGVTTNSFGLGVYNGSGKKAALYTYPSENEAIMYVREDGDNEVVLGTDFQNGNNLGIRATISGNDVFEIRTDKKQIAGWTFNQNKLVSPGGQVQIKSAKNSLQVDPSGGGNNLHVMHGQTYDASSGNWTGNYGVAASDNDGWLFRLDDGAREIAGWRFTTDDIRKDMSDGKVVIRSDYPGMEVKSDVGKNMRLYFGQIYDNGWKSDYGIIMHDDSNNNVPFELSSRMQQISGWEINNNYIENTKGSSDVRLGETFYSGHYGVSVYKSGGNYARLIHHPSGGYELDIDDGSSYFYAGNGYRFNQRMGVGIKHNGTELFRAVGNETPWIDSLEIRSNATVRGSAIVEDELFAQEITFSGNLYQNINNKTVFQVSAKDRQILIADDNGNKTASLTKQGNLSINKLKNYKSTSYDATSGNADSTPSTVKYYLDVSTPDGPGRIPVYETPDTQAPDTPSNLSVSDGTDFAFADINFDAASDNGGSGIDYYNIYRAASYNGNYQIVKETNRTDTTDGAVNPGEKYWYKVSAVDNAGNESSLSGYESAYITKNFDYQPPGDDDRLDESAA